MKNGKKPTVKQSNFIASKGLNARSWLVVKDTPNFMQLVHRHSERTTRIINKENKDAQL